MKLYNKLMEGISTAIESSLNEMAKDVSYRTIDKKLWASVSVMCSREKATEAEFAKPYGPDKNDKDRMVQRYVAALLIMKKPCPSTLEEMNELKTFKLIGARALDLGATFADIKKCYDENKYIKSSERKRVVEEPVVEEPAPEPVKELTLMDQFNEKFEVFKENLMNNNVDAFIDSLNDVVRLITNAAGDRRFRWKMYMGKDSYGPEIVSNKCNYHLVDGVYSYKNSNLVIKDGENFLSRLDRAYSWDEPSYFSRWDRNKYVSKIYVEISGIEELSCEFSRETGPECKQELLNVFYKHFSNAVTKISKVLDARNNFDSTKYGFDKEPANYIQWVVTQAPIMLRNNGYTSKASWYAGISIKGADCSFYTGSLLTLTPDGIIVWVGGDSTDDENKIPYSEWAYPGKYRWYSDTAKEAANISFDDKKEFSKNIYNYLKLMVKDGKIK